MKKSLIVSATVLVIVIAVAALWPVKSSFKQGIAGETDRAEARTALSETTRVDWQALQEQATRDLQTYIRFNTTNPPGGERPAAEWLAGRLQSEGIDARVEETATGRYNMIARLPGTGKGSPILLVSHVDVVPAEAAQWQHDPFGAGQIGGEVWGRGAIDDKGPGIMQAYTLIALKRAGITLDRDIIMIAVADEEAGGYEGMKVLLEHHPEWKDADFAVVGEPVGRMQAMGKNVLVVGAGEKGQVALHISLGGKGGHASSPDPGQALPQLAAGMNRLYTTRQKAEIDPIAMEGFGRVGAQIGGFQGWMLQRLSWAPIRSLAVPIMSKDPGISAMLHTTFAWTVLQSGEKFNVIPTRAEATLDMRILPSSTVAETKEWVRKTLNLPQAKIDDVVIAEGSRSDINNKALALLEALVQEQYPDTVVSPQVLSYGSDAKHLRAVGIPSYVVTPATLEREVTDRVHGNDERIPVAALGEGARNLFVWMVAAGRS